MSVVVNLNAHRNKGSTMRAVRELLVLAARGRIAGLRFDVELTDGARKHGATGKFAHSQAAADLPELISLPVRHSKP